MRLLYYTTGVWCEDVVLGSELQLLSNSLDDDHLVIAFDQGARHGSTVGSPAEPAVTAGTSVT